MLILFVMLHVLLNEWLYHSVSSLDGSACHGRKTRWQFRRKLKSVLFNCVKRMDSLL